MNQEELQKNIALYYSKLPENLQRFFTDLNWLNTLQEINNKYNLAPDQIETLSTETTLVLLCIIPMDEYIKMLESEIKIPREQMDTLLDEINERLFKDIGYDIEDTFIKNASNLAEEKAIEKGEVIKSEEMGSKEQVVSSRREDMAIKSEELIIKNEDISSKQQVVSSKEKEKTNIEEDEVPKPPYAEVIKNEELIIKNEVAKEIPSVPVKPVQEVKSDVFEDKLKGSVSGGSNVSEYNSKTPDPYREPF